MTDPERLEHHRDMIAWHRAVMPRRPTRSETEELAYHVIQAEHLAAKLGETA